MGYSKSKWVNLYRHHIEAMKTPYEGEIDKIQMKKRPLYV